MQLLIVPFCAEGLGACATRGDLMVQEVIVGQFSKIGARILTADGVDLTNDGDDPTRRLIRQVLGAVSEFEKRVIVLKLRAARERKRARGERVEGVKPYGHFPAEQHLVEHMRLLRRKPRKGHERFQGQHFRFGHAPVLPPA